MGKPKFSNADLTRWKQEINPAPIIGSRITLSRENSEYVAVCPFHPDKNPSFKLYKDDAGIWLGKCFGCGISLNAFQFVQKFDNISFTDAVEKVLQEAGVAGWQDGASQPDPSLPEQPPKENITFPMAKYTPTLAALERSAAGQQWLANRGIGMGAARKFKLGFVQSVETISPSNAWVNDGWVLFPTISADNATITAVKYRSLIAKKGKGADGKENSGILRAPNTSTTIFNLQAVTPHADVWIVEGEPDTVVLGQAGLTAVGLPMAGYKPTDEECELLSGPKRRFLAGDNDDAGRKAMKSIADRVRGATFSIIWPNNRKDANDVLTNECDNDPTIFQALLADIQARAIQTVTEPVYRKSNEIRPTRINWLWPGKLPLGKISLLAGNPDNGKSLAGTSIAAITSTGGVPGESPFTCKPSDVLMLIGEDDLDDTVVPRLMAAQADLKRIEFLVAARPVKQEDREVRLDWDLPTVAMRLEQNTDIRLLIIDPISNYLGEKSMVAEQEVRSILIPLKRMAEKHNVAVVIVMHLNKKNDLDAISRVGGAMAFIGVARCSWLFSRDAHEKGEDGESVESKPDTFSMLRIKNNLVSASRAGLSYSVTVRPIPIEGGMIDTPYVVWGAAIEGSADDALSRPRGQAKDDPVTPRGPGRPNNKLQAAIKWLEEALQDGTARRSRELRKDAKDAAGISNETLDRAYEAMAGHMKPRKDSTGAFVWQLEPMSVDDEMEGETPQQSELLRVEGAE